MSALDDLKDRIDSAIYTNTEQNITGDGLQTVLDDMVDTMGVSVSQNIETGKTELLIGDTPALIVDNEPEAGSDNLVKSGGCYNFVDSIINGTILFQSVSGTNMPNTGYVNYDTGELGGGGYNTSDFIAVQKGDIVSLPTYGSDVVAILSAYSSNSQSAYIKEKSVAGSDNAGQMVSYVVPSGVSYIRMSCADGELSDFNAIVRRDDGVKHSIDELNKDISDIHSEIEGTTVSIQGSDLSNAGFVDYDTGNLGGGGYSTSDFIAVSEGDTVKLPIYGSSSVAILSAYSSNVQNSYIKSKSVAGSDNAGQIVTYTVPSGVSHIRMSCNNDVKTLFTATIENDGIQDAIRELQEKIGYSVTNNPNFITPTNLLVKSRCSVNFSFDDGNAKDAQIKAVFDEFGLKCGFAIYESAQRYIDYAKQGFEILAHNTEPLYNADEATIRASMLQGKSVIEGMGLKCHGWVTPNSELPVSLSWVTNDYFEYGYSVYKAQEITGQTMVSSMKSYDLWRCGIDNMYANYQTFIADAIQNNGMISVYAHAADLDNGWTLAQLRTILQYCVTNGIEVLTPYYSCLKLFEDRHN